MLLLFINLLQSILRSSSIASILKLSVDQFDLFFVVISISAASCSMLKILLFTWSPVDYD